MRSNAKPISLDGLPRYCFDGKIYVKRTDMAEKFNLFGNSFYDKKNRLPEPLIVMNSHFYEVDKIDVEYFNADLTSKEGKRKYVFASALVE